MREQESMNGTTSHVTLVTLAADAPVDLQLHTTHIASPRRRPCCPRAATAPGTSTTCWRSCGATGTPTGRARRPPVCAVAGERQHPLPVIHCGASRDFHRKQAISMSFPCSMCYQHL